MEKQPPVDFGITKENYDKNAPPLDKKELKEAKTDLIRNYRKVARHKVDPPIPNQDISIVSFMLLNEPKDGVHGFLKIRGTYGDVDRATDRSEEIIGKIDSVFPVHQARVGYWCPITNNPKYSAERLDVKTEKDEIALRDRASKENAEKNVQKQRELQERKEEMKKLEEYDHDPDSLDYYTKKRVSKKELEGYLFQAKQKIKNYEKTLKKIDKEIIQLNKNHPEYVDMWLENYNKGRKKVGLDPISEQDLTKPKVIGNI